jgi:hypothetical protein
MQQLQETGLRDFGIENPRIFWDQLVNPTWMEGSTTGVGYKKVLRDRIIATLQPDMTIHRRARLADAVADFVDRYFSRSVIDPRWASILRRINAHHAVKTVIATDHYAEATGTIVRFLGKWQIMAKTATGDDIDSPTAHFIVANSADIGFHKADPRFWKIVKANLNIDAVRRILLIDDFGANEQNEDDYGNRRKVEKRMKETVLTLQAVFSTAVNVFPVITGIDANEHDSRPDHVLEEAAATVDGFLMSCRAPAEGRIE